MAYKNNELIIYCKHCKTSKKLRTKRYILHNGNFCSRECYKNWSIYNAQTDEEKRIKWNKYQLEYSRRPEVRKRFNEYLREKRYNDPKAVARRKKVHVKALLKILKERVNILKKTFVCGQCNKKFIGKSGYRDFRTINASD